MVQLLERYAAKLQLLGSNPSLTCICGIYFPSQTPLVHMNRIRSAQRLNNISTIVYNCLTILRHLSALIQYTIC